MVVLIIATVAMFNVNIGSKSSKLSDISLANVEALAEESFIFNGQQWDDASHWYSVVGDWKPVVVACSITVSGGSSSGGSVSGGFGDGSVTIPTPTNSNSVSMSYNGHFVQCQGGSGNCFDGTGCVGDAS